MPIRSLIRTIPDYPKPGIQFRDVTTLLGDAEGLKLTIAGMVKKVEDIPIDIVAGIEARGFILAPAIALALGVGFVPVRKPGKLPAETIGEDYELEYGTDRVEIHADAVKPGQNVLLVDDLIATGGTACAAIRLIERAGGKISTCAFIADLSDLGGGKKLLDAGHSFFALCAFEGE